MDEPAAGHAGSLARSGSDAALVLAAVDRMQRAELHARLSLIRLRSGLAEMALAIGSAKARAASTNEQAREIDTAALLDEFEHRIDALLEIAGGKPAPKPAAPEPAAPEPAAAGPAAALPEPVQAATGPAAAPEPAAEAPAADAEQVPTISGVVSGVESGLPTESGPSPHDAALAAAAAGPTVEMLRSLVQALNASIPAEPVAAEQPSAETPPATENIADVTLQTAQEAVAAPQSVAAVGEPLTPEPIQEAAPEAAQGVVEETAELAEPLVFDVVVEFDKAEPEASPEVLAAEASAVSSHQAVAPEAVAAIVEPEIAATPEPGPQVVETVATAEPAPTQPAAEPTIPEYVLADLPAMPYEASPDDIAEPAAAAALSHPEIAAEATTPDQASAESPPQSSFQIVAEISPQAPLPHDAVVIHEVDLLARFEQMEAMPLLPLEIGTAVIFNPRSTPEPKIAEAPEPPASDAPGPEATAVESFPVEAAVHEVTVVEAVVFEAAAAEVILPEPAMPEPAAELAIGILPAAETQEPPASEAPASELASLEAMAVEVAGAGAAEAVVFEAATVEAVSREPPVPAPAAEPATEILPAARAPHAAVQPTLEVKPPAQPEPEATAGEGWIVEFKRPATLLPSLDLDHAPPAEAAAGLEPKAAAPMVRPALPAAELSAIEAVIAEAFPELRAAAGPAPSPAAAPGPTAEAAPEPVQNLAELLAQGAASETAQAAAVAEPAATPLAEIEPVPEAAAALPPVDLDTEFDTEEFLFGEDAAKAAATGALPVATPEAAAAAAAPEAAAAAAGAEKRPDPLIPIKAMSPEERIALFS